MRDREILADVVFATTLVDMYAKCGTIDKVLELFDKIAKRNVMSWNVMIIGYAQMCLLTRLWTLL